MTSPRDTSPSKVELAGLIVEFDRVRAELIAAVAALPPRLRNVPFVGHWDVKDVVAHTIGWDRTNIDALPDFRAGRLPAFFARYDADWAAINADLIARYRIEDWDELLASLRHSQQAFVDAMSEFTDADLDTASFWGDRRVTLRGMLRAATRDESEHVAQVSQFVDSTTDRNG